MNATWLGRMRELLLRCRGSSAGWSYRPDGEPFVEPTALVSLALAASDFVGVLHLGGPERLSRLEMGRRLAAALGVDAPDIRAVRREDDRYNLLLAILATEVFHNCPRP